MKLFRTPGLARPLCALVAGSLLTSCATLIPHNAKVRLSDPSNADAMQGYDTYGAEVQVNANVIRCNNRQLFYTVERTKKGYLPAYTTINQNGINPMLAIDGGIFLIGTIMLLSSGGGDDNSGSSSSSSSSSEGNGGKIWGATLMSYGGLGLLIGKKKSFKNSAAMEEMTPIPSRSEEQMYVYVDKVDVKLSSGSVETRNFNNITNYKNNLTATGEIKEKRKVTATFNVEDLENLDLSDDLNAMLAGVDYVDTTNTMFRMSNNANIMEVQVTKWGYNYIAGGAYSFQITSKWDLKDNLSKQSIMTREFTTASDIIVDDSDNGLYRKGFVNALGKAMVQVMGDAEFASAMMDKKKKFQSTLDAWPEIVVQPGKYDKQKLSESSKSVVTVKTKDGHGSGVFISKDGLLITNLHVTGQQTEDLEILLSDGKKLTGRVERSNPVYDLALLRVEGFTGKPIAINLQQDIELGEPVYAIGTPTDLALGQTLTKGIISSKRVFNELDYIQTDVSINRGNSGGALLNENGQLVGVVNAKIIGQGIEGVGFAIPNYYIPSALKLKLQ